MFFKKKKPKQEAKPPPRQAPAPGPAPPPQASHPAEPMFKEAMNVLNAERFDEAIDLFNKLRHEYPDFEPSLVYYGLATAYDSRGMLEPAVNMMIKSVEANVQNYEAHIHLGNIYSKMGRHPDAIAEFTFVIENNPEHELVPALKGQVQELRNFSPEDALARLQQEVEALRHLIKQQFKINMDFSAKSLEILNMIMDTGWSDVNLAGGYIGEVIVRNLGGQWNMVIPRGASTIEGIGQPIKPFEIAATKVERAKEYSLLFVYQDIAARFG